MRLILHRGEHLLSRLSCVECNESLERIGTTVFEGALVHASCRESYKNKLDAEKKPDLMKMWIAIRGSDVFGVYHKRECRCPDCIEDKRPDIPFSYDE